MEDVVGSRLVAAGSKHTPTPWSYDGADIGMIKKDGKLVALVYGQPAGEEREDLVEMRANIDLILRAVNSHAEMVAELEATAGILSALIMWIDRGLAEATFNCTGASIRDDIEERLNAVNTLLAAATRP